MLNPEGEPEVVFKFLLYRDKDEIDRIRSADKVYCALWDIQQLLRSKDKYQDPTPEVQSLIDEIREILADAPLHLWN